MRVAIVENTAGTQHGQVGIALNEAGAIIDVFRPFQAQQLPESMQGYDALIVFGGEQSALSDDLYPYLPGLAQLMRDAVDSGLAMLGICLGSQLLARGFGATNHIGTAPEFGWSQVSLTEEGRADPVLGSVERTFETFQWHSDSFDLPHGAIHLAKSGSVENQAFRIGRAGYATQFHLEANRAVVADWTRRFPDLIEQRSAGWIVDHARQSLDSGQRADANGLAIARAFVGQIN